MCNFKVTHPDPSCLISPPNLAYLLFYQVVYGLFILFFIIKEIRNLTREGKMYFSSFWNWVEMIIIILSIIGAGIFIYRLILTLELTEEFKRTNGKISVL